MNDQLQTTISDILRALQEGAQQYGPKALEVALQLKRLEGIGDLLSGLAGAVGLAIIARILWKIFAPRPITPEQQSRVDELKAKGYARRSTDEDRELNKLTGNTDFLDHPELMFHVFWLLPIAVCFAAASELLDIWNWAAVFQPGLALAHDILQKISNH